MIIKYKAYCEYLWQEYAGTIKKNQRKQTGGKMMHRKRKIALKMAVVLVIAGVGVYGGKWILKNNSSEQSEQINNSDKKNIASAKTQNSNILQAEGTTSGGTDYQLYNLNLKGTSKTGALEVESVLKSSGDEVKKGDALIKLTKDSVSDTRKILYKAVKTYKKKYVSAKLDYEEAVYDAKSDYQESLSAYSSALIDYKHSLSEYTGTVKEAKKQLDKSKKIISTYPVKIKNSKKTLSAKQKQLSSVNKKIKKAKKQVESKAKVLATKQKSYEQAKQKYDELSTVSRYIGDFSRENKSDISQLTTNVEQKLASAKKDMESKNTAYSKALKSSTSVEKTYEQYNTKKTQLSNSISTLKNNISLYGTNYKNAKLNLNNYSSTYNQALSEETTGKVSAKKTYDESVKAYKNADTVYNAAIKSAKDTLQKAKDNYTNAKARVAAFNKLISGNNVVAQMSGILSEMSYESGDMLNSMTAIAGYSNENTLSIDVTVDQTDIGKISVGDEASVSVQNMPQTVTGKVAAIETSSSSESVSKVTYTVTVSIDNSQKMLSSGAATQVIFNQNNEENEQKGK